MKTDVFTPLPHALSRIHPKGYVTEYLLYQSKSPDQTCFANRKIHQDLRCAGAILFAGRVDKPGA